MFVSAQHSIAVELHEKCVQRDAALWNYTENNVFSIDRRFKNGLMLCFVYDVLNILYSHKSYKSREDCAEITERIRFINLNQNIDIH